MLRVALAPCGLLGVSNARIFVRCCRTRGRHSATGQRLRRRVLRPDVTGGGFGGASGTAPVVRHGRPSEVQAALYTGAQPVGGHYREFSPFAPLSLDPRDRGFTRANRARMNQ